MLFSGLCQFAKRETIKKEQIHYSEQLESAEKREKGDKIGRNNNQLIVFNIRTVLQQFSPCDFECNI